ncbi:MAG TPA: hypothetical protein VK525_08530 [Candidatus Saccharimonadales bacterium]|jgi:hypothetical protein|nr:hypothetical protein [Candidatus Saccharimonadales bacterium]
MATLASIDEVQPSPQPPVAIAVPASTAWPIVLALGFTLVFAGLLTSVSVSALGLVLGVAGCVGWFREVLPHEHEETVPVVPDEVRLTTERRTVERLQVPTHELRAWLPVRTYPISSGVKGGVAGSIAMAFFACVYGILKVGSVWYPINLLAAVAYRESTRLAPAHLYSFHADTFAIAFLLHGLVSILVGLLYGAMLPIFPRRAILLGGLVAPVLWSGLVYTLLGLLNPLLASHIDWFWFIVSQMAFGIVAGNVVVRQASIPTRENVAFALRAGIEAPGIIPPREAGERRQ